MMLLINFLIRAMLCTKKQCNAEKVKRSSRYLMVEILEIGKNLYNFTIFNRAIDFIQRNTLSLHIVNIRTFD